MELPRTTTERLVTAVAAVCTPFMKPKSCWDFKLDDAVGGGGRMRSWLRGKAGIGMRSGWGKVGTRLVRQSWGKAVGYKNDAVGRQD